MPQFSTCHQHILRGVWPDPLEDLLVILCQDRSRWIAYEGQIGCVIECFVSYVLSFLLKLHFVRFKSASYEALAVSKSGFSGLVLSELITPLCYVVPPQETA
jgi:hypothetical protein